MRFSDLVSTVLLHSDKTVPRSNVEVVLKGLSKAARAELMRTGTFALPGVARFDIKQRKARKGRNPRNGNPVDIPARRVLGVRPLRELKEVL